MKGAINVRKYKRYALRRYAERTGRKPSAYVAEAWERYQIGKLGLSARRANQRHGTKPRNKWRAA